MGNIFIFKLTIFPLKLKKKKKKILYTYKGGTIKVELYAGQKLLLRRKPLNFVFKFNFVYVSLLNI